MVRHDLTSISNRLDRKLNPGDVNDGKAICRARNCGRSRAARLWLVPKLMRCLTRIPAIKNDQIEMFLTVSKKMWLSA